MEAINLDLLPGAMPPIVHVSQGDVGRQFSISVYDDTGAAYSLTGKTLSIVGHKGDGHVFQYAIPSSAISGNTVTITTEEQMTPAAGKALCEIRIEEGNTKLGTCNFVMDVEQGPADMGSLSISALYTIDALFERAQADIDTATAAATTATQKANEANSSATAASASASAASTSASNAASSASTASSYASSAATEAGNASDYADAAALSATAAGTSATNAANSATAADTSATAAATSASTASTAASNASTYASAADTSADAASGYADAASASATAAATSATNAAASENAASTSETNAAASATNASASASNAATSETNAANSETSAAGSASAAATSATNAAASEAKIANMTVSSQSVAYTQPAEVTKTEVGGVYNLDFKIPRGEPTSGHDVEANPSGAATEDLTKLGIDGTVYNIAGGGGCGIDVPLRKITKYTVNPTKICEVRLNTTTFEYEYIPLISVNSLTSYSYTVTEGQTLGIIFELCNLDWNTWPPTVESCTPFELGGSTFLQVYDPNASNNYKLYLTTQPAIVDTIDTPLSIDVKSAYINMIPDRFELSLEEIALPVLINGDPIDIQNLSLELEYCYDNYVNGTENNNVKLFIAATFAANQGDVITLDYSYSDYDIPRYNLVVDDSSDADLSYISIGGSTSIIKDYPTFS